MTLATIVSSCVSVGQSTKPSGCEWTSAILLQPQDVDVISDELVDQILAHNETRSALCGQ